MNCDRAAGIGRNGSRLNPLRGFFPALLAATLVFVFSIPASAQRHDGTLRVIVTDVSGAGVFDAKVTVTNEATNVSASTTASSEGTYVFPSLLVGSYTVTIEKDGFKKHVSKGVNVESNLVAEFKTKLEVGSISSSIEVTAGAELVKTTTAELGSSIGGREVNELPINTLGGDVKELAILAPGTTTQEGGVLGSGGSIGGTRPRFNGFSIDGVDDNRVDVNGPTQPVIQESVAEFTLLTNQFSAEYGHSAGGLFATTTKSGGNQLHGTAWGYNQNRNYNAMDNLEKARGHQDRFDYNRVGASIGGPIRKDKLFFFGAYEFQNNGLAASSPSADLPTASGLAALQAMATHQAVKDILAQFPTAPTKTATTMVNGTPIDVGTFQSIAPSFSNQHDFIVNGDANFGEHRLHTGFLYDRFRAPDFNAVLPQTQFLGTNQADARKAIISDAWTVSRSVVNDFRFSYSRLRGPALVVPSQFANFPNVGIDNLGINLGPDGNAPQSYGQNIYQWSDAISWVKGKHTVKFGAEVRKYINPSVFLPRARGEWDYATLQTLINDLVPDGGNGALRGAGSGSFSSNFNAAYWFLQDDLKLTSRLTLNLGLRYEYSGTPRDANLQAGNAISDDPNFGLFFRAPKPDVNNFAPRIGFAYDPTGNGKWAIRGGAGLAYDVTPTNFAQLQLPPQLQSEQNPAVTCVLPGAPAWCTNPSAGFLQSGGLLQVNVPPTTQTDARAATQGLNIDIVAPKVLTWSLGVQHEVMKNTSVELLYVGTHSVHLPVQFRLNEVSAFDSRFPGGGLKPLPTYFSNSAVPTSFPLTSQRRADFDNFLNNGLFQPLAVDGFFSVFTTFQPAGQGIYHAGSVDVNHRMGHGLRLIGSYTFAKNIDNATNELFSSRVNPRRPQDTRDLRNERGRSVLDIHQKLAIGWLYDLPNVRAENALAKGFLHGWEVAGTYLAQTGQPITALSGTDSNANGSSAGDRTITNPAGVGNTGSGVNFVCINGNGVSSIVTSTGACTGGSANIVGYVAQNSTARFVQAGLGAFPTTGRNTVSTPGLNLWNIAAIKTTKIGERYSFQVRVETYDTFNHRNYSIGLPTNNGALDQVTNANPLSTAYPFVTAGNLFLNNQQFNGGSRRMQFGLKFIW